MTCPRTPCLRSSGKQCRCFQRPSANDSLSILPEEPLLIGSLTGSDDSVPPFPPPPSSGRDKALLLLSEAWDEVSKNVTNGRERSLAMTKIEEAEMWLLRALP